MVRNVFNLISKTGKIGNTKFQTESRVEMFRINSWNMWSKRYFSK